MFSTYASPWSVGMELFYGGTWTGKGTTHWWLLTYDFVLLDHTSLIPVSNIRVTNLPYNRILDEVLPNSLEVHDWMNIVETGNAFVTLGGLGDRNDMWCKLQTGLWCNKWKKCVPFYSLKDHMIIFLTSFGFHMLFAETVGKVRISCLSCNHCCAVCVPGGDPIQWGQGQQEEALKAALLVFGFCLC